MKINLSESIEKLPKINKKIVAKLKKIGIKKIKDLLYHFPNRYEDFSHIIEIKNAKLNKVAAIQGKVLNIKNIKTPKKKMTLTKALVEDKSGNIIALWFNQPFLLKNIKKGDIVNLAGKITLGKDGLYISNPAYEIISKFQQNQNKFKKEINYSPAHKETIHTGRLVPIYSETKGLSSKWLRFLIKSLLKFCWQIPDILPPEIKKNQKLPNIQWALNHIHFPNTKNEAKLAKKRFAFEELFLLQLLLLKTKKQIQQETAVQIKLDIELIKNFLKTLPFVLTIAQKKALWQILKDLEKPFPMNRLLEGDVGSGKTIVALITALVVSKSNFQTAFMVPTEILAQQHFKTFINFLKNQNIAIALLTSGSIKFFNKKRIQKTKKDKIIEKIKNNEIQIIIGTHSLIAEKKSNNGPKFKFKNLGLVIIDEQHRFGVYQRAKLLNLSKKTPHLLSMTATPIPRTLALTLYGELDISIIDELPKGRKKIITKIIKPEKRQAAYKFIEKEILAGHKIFIICPRIETHKETENKKTSKQKLLWQEVKAVKDEYKKLSKKVFPKFKVGMLHGKMKSQEKEKIISAFNKTSGKNKIDILVSTSAVEVGVDIKNATVMIIEGAERFGLAQLHQFRGRIGRNKYQSYCLLFTSSKNQQENARLKALVKCENGFELAQKDLELRGPGDFWGSQQWGLPDLTMASLNDLPLIEKTRQEAKKIIEKDPNLKSYPLLKEKLENYKNKIHFE